MGRWAVTALLQALPATHFISAIQTHEMSGHPIDGWLRGPAVEHWSLADVLLPSCARLVADG